MCEGTIILMRFLLAPEAEVPFQYNARAVFYVIWAERTADLATSGHENG